MNQFGPGCRDSIGRARSQAAVVECFGTLRGRFAEEGVETRPGLGIGEDGIPSFVLLAGKQESGEVRDFFALVGRKRLAKFGDFSGAHDGRVVDSAWEFNLETEMEQAWEWKPCPVRAA